MRGDKIEIKNILFPCDLREPSLKLLPYVVSMSDKYSSMIYLLHVIEDISKWGGMYIPHVPMELYQKEAIEATEKVVDKIYREDLNSRPNFQSLVLSGKPASEILRVIDSKAIDLVIMGTHGYKGLERTIFGSVAEKVVRESSAPVLIINPNKI